MREDVKKWLDKSKSDLKKAKDNFDIGHYDLASFMCQQSAEKALKAFLIFRDDVLIKSHDLVNLGRKAGISSELLKKCKDLNPVYAETRYPDVSEDDFTKEDSEEDIKIAEEILKWVEGKI